MLAGTDIICLEAVKRGYVTVDAENGICFSKRFGNKSIGSARSKAGYKVATLHVDGQRKQVKLHRLIWIAVNGIPPKGMMIDHINRTKTDNRINNLRLVNATENSRNRRPYNGARNPAAKINKSIADEIRNSYLAIKSYQKTAVKFNVSTTLIARIIRKEMWI